MFTLTTTTIHSDFLAPPLDQYEREVGEDPEWQNKTIETVLWRGTTTGADLGNDHHKAWSQRVRLCRRSFSFL